MTARPPLAVRPVSRDREAGVSTVEYVAMLLVLAGIVVALVATSGIGTTVASGVEAAVCRVAGGDCTPATSDRTDAGASGDTTTSSDPVTPEEWGGRSTDPFREPPEPTEDEQEAGQDAADQIRDYLGNDDAWYKPWTWGGDDPENPRDILAGMSPGEIDALFGELSDDEIRDLLGVDGVPEILRLRADPHLLQQLEGIAPDSIEPDFNDVRENGEKPSDPADGYGHIPNAELFGEDGPSLDDINQGAIGDCWWMASMGALAQTEEGRNQLQSMITENPNGTYTVRFPDGERVTVTPFFPVKKAGNTAYAQPGGDPPVIWPLVLEKAMAEKAGGYGDLVGGRASEGMETLTGQDSSTYDTGDITQSELEGWLEEGGVTASSLQEDDSEGKEPYEDGRFVAGHAYVVQGVTSDGKVQLYNPWGTQHATVTMDEFNRYFRSVDTNPVR